MARGTGTVLVKFLGDTSDLKKASDDAEGHLSKVGGAIGGMAKTAALVGVPALAGFGVAAVKAFAESEEVAAQTEAVIKSTGGAAKITAGHVGDLAGSLSAMSGVDDEVIQSGENVLLTFTNIRNAAGKNNDIFDQATKTALDMSVALGTDLQGANIQLGKALNDPIKGITALSRVGVSFTDQQKEQIKTLVASGKTMEAQKIILAELQTEFGGSAKAAGDTFAGQLNKLKVQMGNFMEEAGGRIVPILMSIGEWFGARLPAAIDTISTAWLGFMEGLEGQGTNTNKNPLIRFAGQAGDAIHDLLPTITAIWDTVQDVFGKVAGWIEDHRQQITTALNAVGELFSSVFGAIQAVVVTAIDFLKGVWRVFGDDLTSFAREAWAGIVETFRGAINTLTGIFDLIKALFTGQWGDAWEAVKKIVDGAWDTVFGLFRNAITNVIPTILAGLGQLIASAFETAFNGLKEPFKAVLNWMIDRINDFVDVALAPLKLANKIPGIGSVVPDIPHIPHLQHGGTFRGAAVVGEAGPELLLGAGRVVPNNQLGGSVTVNFYGPQDRAGVAREIEGILTDFVRQGGNLRFQN